MKIKLLCVIYSALEFAYSKQDADKIFSELLKYIIL